MTSCKIQKLGEITFFIPGNHQPQKETELLQSFFRLQELTRNVK